MNIVHAVLSWLCMSVAAQAEGVLVNGRWSQPSGRVPQASAQPAAAIAATERTSEDHSPSRPECEAVDLETILKERDACGVGHVFLGAAAGGFLRVCYKDRIIKGVYSMQVGFIANLKNQRSHVIVEQVGSD